ncbi:cycloheximide-inducible CIP70 (cytochrome P450 family) [Fusarium coicis]|nr:cycloheximide-inducible CIP70 (cytochrome P450 family) [Fusarium coicis]
MTGNKQSLLDLIANRWPLLATALLVCFVAAVAPRIVNVLRLWAIPTIVQDGIFLITTSRTSPTIVISPVFLPELKKLPDATLSMEAAVDESMETKYTKIEASVPIIPHTIKGELTPSLSRLSLTIATEVRDSMNLTMPPCDDWTEVNIHHALLRIVGMVSGRMFIGPELCRSEQYLDAAINYTIEVMGAQHAVQNMRPWLRPFRAQILPEVQKLYQRIVKAEAFLEPVVRRRTDAMNDSSYEKPDDFLQWLIDRKDKFPDKNSQNLAKVQLGLTFAAVHTTTLTATNAFYDLAALPDLQIELREEVREALSQSGGQFTSNALQSMKKMDSFLKETLRVHPATMASFQHKVLKPFTLSNGQVIPAGVTIEIPAVAVSSDSNIFPHAEKFDPLRFYRLRTEAKDGASVEKAANNQFASVNQSSLTFGYGRHACPGRFFAANEIKMILAHALLHYDVKNVGDATERYPNMEFAHMSIPDPSKNSCLSRSRCE